MSVTFKGFIGVVGRLAANMVRSSDISVEKQIYSIQSYKNVLCSDRFESRGSYSGGE